MRSKKTLRMVQLAVLAALILIMSMTPLGYLRYGGLSISFLTIPVAIGAMIIGPAGGAVLGGVFGLTSFAQCFAGDLIGMTLLGINPFLTFVMCVPTRILMGLCTGLIFNKLRKADSTKTVSYFVTGFLAAVLNTVFFMFTLVACFWNTEIIQGYNQALGGHNVIVFIALFVGINSVFEMIATSAVSGVIAKAVNKAMHSSAARK